MIASFPVIPDSKAIAHEWKDFQSVDFCYVQSYILLLCWLNQCYYFCQDCSDSPDCPDGLLANLWFHSLLLLMREPEKTLPGFQS